MGGRSGQLAASYPGISAFTRCLATVLSAATTSVKARRVQQGARLQESTSSIIGEALCFCSLVCMQVH